MKSNTTRRAGKLGVIEEGALAVTDQTAPFFTSA